MLKHCDHRLAHLRRDVVHTSAATIMTEPPAKLAKLQLFRSKLPYLSHTALAAVLKAARSEPLPDVCSRRSVGRARDETVQELTPYGKLHQSITVETADGGQTSFEVQHPLAMFYKACGVSESFGSLVSRTVDACPPSVAAPWSIVLYADEILPGNQLSYKSARKVWGFYWTVLEFGSAVHSDEVVGQIASIIDPGVLQHHPTCLY